MTKTVPVQFRLHVLLLAVSCLCLSFAAFAYVAFHRPVQFWANGASWEINGPIAYTVAVEKTKETDGVFLSQNASGPTGVRLLLFGTAGLGSSHNPADPVTHGTKRTFPLKQNQELTIPDINGTQWLYRFTFQEQPLWIVAVSGLTKFALIMTVVVAGLLGVRYLFARRNRKAQVDSRLQKGFSQHHSSEVAKTSA